MPIAIGKPTFYRALLGTSLTSVTLAWDTVTGAAGYRLYFGSTSHFYTTGIDVGDTNTWTVGGLARGTTYYFSVTSYLATGLESVYAPEVSYTPPPRAWIPLRINLVPQ